MQRELERNNWYTASIDSQTILQELLNRTKPDGDDFDPFGIETWNKFAERIGRVNNNTATDATERFDDCMLLEWIRVNLLTDKNTTLMLSLPPTRAPGTLLRASCPFLLDNQEFHKSLLLILEDSPIATIGVLLNLPGTDSVTVDGESISIRYGGKFGIQGQPVKPVTWYHSKESLRQANVGTPVGASKTGIWTCTRDDAEAAIKVGLASLDDFLVLQGATVLPKNTKNAESLAVLDKFDVIPRSHLPQVWDALLSQEGLTRESLNEYMEAANSTWASSMGSDDKDSTDESPTNDDFSSVAWKSWICTFLLCDPKLRGS